MKVILEPYNGDQPYSFISYSHKDKDKVLPILEKLQQVGFRLWFDEGIEWGTEWPMSIQQHIFNSSVFIPFISSNFANSDNCQRELVLALRERKKMLAIFLEDIDLNSVPGALALQLGPVQSTFPFQYDSEDKFYERLFNNSILQETRELQINKEESLEKLENLITQNSSLLSQAELLMNLLQNSEQLENLINLVEQNSENSNQEKIKLIESNSSKDQKKPEELSYPYNEISTLSEEDNKKVISFSKKKSKESVFLEPLVSNDSTVDSVNQIPVEENEKLEINELNEDNSIINSSSKVIDITNNITKSQEISKESTITGLHKVCIFRAPINGYYEEKEGKLSIIPTNDTFYSPIKKLSGIIVEQDLSWKNKRLRILYSNHIYLDIEVKYKTNESAKLVLNKDAFINNTSYRKKIKYKNKEPLFILNHSEVSEITIVINSANSLINLVPDKLGNLSAKKKLGHIYSEHSDFEGNTNEILSFFPPIYGKIINNSSSFSLYKLEEQYPYLFHYVNTGTYLEITNDRTLYAPVNGTIHFIPDDSFGFNRSRLHFLSFHYNVYGKTNEVVVCFEFDNFIRSQDFMEFLNLSVEDNEEVQAKQKIGYLESEKIHENPKVYLLFPHSYFGYKYLVKNPDNSIINEINSPYVEFTTFDSFINREIYFRPSNESRILLEEGNLISYKLTNKTINTPITGNYQLKNKTKNRLSYEITTSSQKFYAPSNVIVKKFDLKETEDNLAIKISLNDLDLPLTYLIELKADNLDKSNISFNSYLQVLSESKENIIEKGNLLFTLFTDSDLIIHFKIDYQGIEFKTTKVTDKFLEAKSHFITIKSFKVPEQLIETLSIQFPIKNNFLIENELYSNLIIPEIVNDEFQNDNRLINKYSIESFPIDIRSRSFIAPCTGVLGSISCNKDKTSSIVIGILNETPKDSDLYLPIENWSAILVVSFKYSIPYEDMQNLLLKLLKSGPIILKGDTLLKLSDGYFSNVKLSIFDPYPSFRHLFFQGDSFSSDNNIISGDELILTPSNYYFRSDNKENIEFYEQDFSSENLEDKELEKNLKENKGFLVIDNNSKTISGRNISKPYLVRGIIISPGVTNIESEAFKNIYAFDIYLPEDIKIIGNNAFTYFPNATIYGYENTPAKTYAEKYNFPFKKHFLSKTKRKDMDYEKFKKSTLNLYHHQIDSIELPNIKVIPSYFFRFIVPEATSYTINSLIIPKGTKQEKNALSDIILKKLIYAESSEENISNEEPISKISNTQVTTPEEYYESKLLQLQQSRKEKGLCQYCGGSFTLFTKKCKNCGRKKDY